jgi:hypothetical protein
MFGGWRREVEATGALPIRGRRGAHTQRAVATHEQRHRVGKLAAEAAIGPGVMPGDQIPRLPMLDHACRIEAHVWCAQEKAIAVEAVGTKLLVSDEVVRAALRLDARPRQAGGAVLMRVNAKEDTPAPTQMH